MGFVGALCPIWLSEDKFLHRRLLILIEHSDNLKSAPTKEKKNRAMHPTKTLVTAQIALHVNYDNKLVPKAKKPILKSSFCLKIKKSNCLIGMVGIIEPLSSSLSSSSNWRKCFKKILRSSFF